MPHDPALIEAARQGDEDALLQLLKACQKDLRRFAAVECASAADADDAVQETMLIVYRRIGMLRTVGSYTTWLYSIVRHECRRLMRRVKRQAEMPDDDDEMFQFHTVNALRVDLADAIRSLPPRYREVILLRDFEEYTVAEMSVALRLSRAAVKSRIHRGREMIREYLAD